MKAIVFNIDWVMIDSLERKEGKIIEILKKYNLYDLEWVQETFKLSLNREVFLDRISELHSFNKERVLEDINTWLALLESNPTPIKQVVDFIKNNSSKYLCFANTSIPRESVERVMEWLKLKRHFKNTLCWSDGTKLENTENILKSYNLDPNDVLFIDDTLTHINNVAPSWVHCLHFTDKTIDLENYITHI